MAQNNIKTRRLNPEGLKNFYEQNPEYLDVCQADTDKKREEEKEEFYDYCTKCYPQIHEPFVDSYAGSFHTEEDLKAHLLNLLQLIKGKGITIEKYKDKTHYAKLSLWKDFFHLAKTRQKYTDKTYEQLKQSLLELKKKRLECSLWTKDYVIKALAIESLTVAIFYREKYRINANESSGNNEQNIANNYESNLLQVNQSHSNSNSFVTFPNALNLDNQDEASEVDLRNFHFDERNLNALLAELNAGNQDNLMTNPYSANQNLCIPQKRPNNELSASNNDEINNEVSQAKRMKQ